MSDPNRMPHPEDLSLDLYLDAELSHSEAQKVEAHLEVCPECRQKLEARRTLFELISASEEVPLSRDVSTTVLGKLQRSRLRLLVGVLSLEAVFASLLLFVAGSSMAARLSLILKPARASAVLMWFVDRFSALQAQLRAGFLAIRDTLTVTPLPGISTLPVAQLNWLQWTGILSAIAVLWVLSNRVLIGRSEQQRSRV